MSRSRSGPHGGARAGIATFPRGRIRFVLVAWLVCLLALLGRVGYLQTARADDLRRIAQRQQVDVVPVPASRGRIYDRNGRVLATNVLADSAYAIPNAVLRPHDFANKVGPVLGVPPGEILRRLERGGYFVWLARHLPADVAGRLRALRLDGQLGFLAEQRRAYPNGVLAAHVLGFAGVDNQGLSGVELQYDRALRGSPGEAVLLRDAMGREIPEGRRLLRPATDGADLVLTIDEVVQHIAERELASAAKQARARGGSVIVMDVRTGGVLALANYPRYNPNRYETADPQTWRNRAIADAYEPGSTFKIVVVAAALDAGRIGEDTTLSCPGYLVVPGNHRIREAHGVAHGRVLPADIVRLSCNVGAALTGARLGPANLHRYARQMGFGSPTGIDLPGESPGILRPVREWSGSDVYTISFGQGIATTPLQLVTAVATMANGGRRVRPHVVSLIRDADGRVRRVIEPTPGPQVLKPSVARAMMEMMVRTVTDGTGTAAAIEGYAVAGKTGTAQKPNPAGGYLAGRFVSSFVGIVPADRPRLAILAMLDEPQGPYYGGVVAAPIFQRVASQTLWYLRVPPAPSTFGDRMDRGRQTGARD
ncbi:MAG: penicillin-binding transpeptidase domain-containing protein [Armatimonadota bacterium]|nr:penicillin-binding transpeptidase domain-containing protein [Armatimonadota bacterium]